jgi:voltage-gated sodium channel
VRGLAKRIASNAHFFDCVLALLIINALLLGAEATPDVAAEYAGLISATLAVLQIAFVIEILIRVAAFAPRPQDFFRDHWNSFDFVIVALSLLPAIGVPGLLARLVRLLRLVRLVSVSDTLRGFASGRVHGAAALVSASLMTGIFFYGMSLAGFYLFAATSDGRWSSMAAASSTVFNLLTLQHIAPIISARTSVNAAAWAYIAVLYAGELAILGITLHHFRRGPATASANSR